MRRLLSLALLTCVLATGALAKPPLRDVAEIDNGVMAVAIADQIRKSCNDINARLITAYTTINALKSKALAQGYTEKEVEQYVTSKEEKARMRAKAERYLADRGVSLGNADSLCEFGRGEIRAETQIGRLLR